MYGEPPGKTSGRFFIFAMKYSKISKNIKEKEELP